MRFIIAVLAISSAFPQFCLAQTTQQLRTLPSSAEILELANKADEKVQVFEKTLKASEPYLDKGTFQTDQEAAHNAHTIINTLRTNGPSMYGLVGLLSTLDDLTLDASRASRVIILAMSQNSLKANSPNDSPTLTVMTLVESENSLYDISDLLLHVTLRYAAAEEDLMGQLLKKVK